MTGKMTMRNDNKNCGRENEDVNDDRDRIRVTAV